MNLAGGAFAIALAAFWKGGLGLLGCAIFLGRLHGSPEPPRVEEEVRSSQATVEDDGSFVEVQLRSLERDRPSYVVLKNPAGRPIAVLGYDYETHQLRFVRAELGAVRSYFWKRHDQGISSRVQDDRTSTQANLGPDHSVDVTVHDADAVNQVLGRIQVPPRDNAPAGRAAPE
jgi:hypothetical protein